MRHKSLSDSFCYRYMNIDDKINSKVADVLKKGKVLTPEEMENQLVLIKKLPYKLQDEVYQSIINKETLVMYKESDLLPSSLPFALIRNGDNMVQPIIFITAWGTIRENKGKPYLDIDGKMFYTLAEAGLVAKSYITRSYMSLKTPVIREGCKLYSAIFTNILNRSFNLNANKTRLNNILTVSAAFYLINVLGMDMKDLDTLVNYAMTACKDPNAYSCRSYIQEFLGDPTEKGYVNPFTDIGAFIQRIRETNPNMGKLGVRNFLEEYMRTYGPTMLLALENFEYFAMNMIAVQYSVYLNNVNILDKLAGNSLSKFYVALVDMV